MTHARRRRAALASALATLLAWGGAFAAECVVVSGASELSVEAVGRIVFVELATDRVADAATFGGGVCLEVAGTDVTVRARSIEVRGVSGGATVRADGAVVEADGWRFATAHLTLDAERAVLVDASLESDDLVARAERFDVDLVDGTVEGVALSVATSSVRAELAFAQFDGVAVRGGPAVVTTCDCPPSEAALRVEGRSLELDVDAGVLEVQGGVLIVGRLRVALPERWVLDDDALADWRPALDLRFDDDRGWLLAVAERRHGDLRVDGDVALGDGAGPPWRVRVGTDVGGDRSLLTVSPGGADFEADAQRPLAPWATVALSQRLRVGDRTLADAALGVRVASPQPAVAPVTLRLRGDVGVALSAQRRGAVDVSTPRAWAGAAVDASAADTPLGRLELTAEAGVTGYAALAGGQRWWALTPRWTWDRGPLRVQATHAHRDVLGSSPFDDAIDRVDPQRRTTLTVRWQPGSPPLRLDGELRFDWRDDPLRAGERRGVERLRVALHLPVVARDVRLDARATVELAGLVDPRQGRDAFARVGVDARWSGPGVEVGVEAVVGLRPDDRRLRSLTLAAAAPLPWWSPTLELTPYLAFDVAPSLRGAAWPALVGHGLAASWTTSYGTVDVAYRSAPDGSTTTRVGLRLPTRTPSVADLHADR